MFCVETEIQDDKGAGCLDYKTLAEYFTNDDTRGNPHCFVEWTGDAETGYMEIWYGCEIENTDIEVFKVNR